MIGKLLTAVLVGFVAGLVAWHGLGPLAGVAIGWCVGILVILAPTHELPPDPPVSL